MKKLLAGLILGLLMAASPATAGEPCPCGYHPHKSKLRRVCDKLFRPGCGYDKTHFDVGCTGCRADCVFVFGSCCEFFGEPEAIRPPAPHRWLSWGK